jgi:hypothetical protein
MPSTVFLSTPKETIPSALFAFAPFINATI